MYAFQGGLLRKRKNARSYSSSHSVPTNSWQQAASIKDTLDCYYSLRNCVFFFSTSTLKPIGLSFLPFRQKPSNCSGKSQGEGEQDGRQGSQGGEASVISCLLYTFLLSYLCASTFFSDPLQFHYSRKESHLEKFYNYHKSFSTKEMSQSWVWSREWGSLHVPTLSLFQSLRRVAWNPGLDHFVLHFTVMNSFVIYILSVTPTFKKPIAQVSQVWTGRRKWLQTVLAHKTHTVKYTDSDFSSLSHLHTHSSIHTRHKNCARSSISFLF